MVSSENKMTDLSKMKLTGARAEKAAQALLFRRTRVYSAEEYRKAIADLQKQQIRATKLSEKRAAATAAKAAAAEAAVEAAREAKREAARQKRNQKARERRAAAKKMYSVHIQTRTTVRRKAENGELSAPFILTNDEYFEAAGSEIKKTSETVHGGWVTYLEQESGLAVLSSEWVEISRVEVTTAVTNTQNVMMKQAGSLFLDGEEQHEFDTGNGTCVIDWLSHRYSTIRGCKKVSTREALIELLGEEVLTTGISAVMLDRVCDVLRCRQYALDETNEIIHTYTPSLLNNNVPPLVYRVKNGHFYPITKEAINVCQMGRITNQAHRKAAEKEAKSLAVVILPKTDETKFEQVVRICQEQNVEVFGRGTVPLHYSDDGLVGFELNGSLYRWESDEMIEATQKIYDLNDMPYDGSTIPAMILRQIKHRGIDEKSQLNPHVGSVLAQAKNRIHYGRLSPVQDNEWAADIIKCYSSCLMNPTEDWCVFSSIDEWAPWDGAYKPGLYFVDTIDMRLFHGTNVYSLAMIKRARDAGIAFTIISQLRPSKVLPKTYFDEIVDDIKTLCHNDISLMKWFFNIFVGMLGKSKHTTINGRMDTDINTVWKEYNADKPGKPFISKCDNYYFYGRQTTQELAEHNLPMWIQILDWSNIKLFDLIAEVESTGGQLVGRKTDCAVFVGGSLVEKLEVGGHRRCDVPTMKDAKDVSLRSLSSAICESDGWAIAPITSSSAIEETAALGGGVLITGFAGTGKTYLAKEVAAKFDGPVLRMAPTNKAALNIGGRTIHKELKIDMAGKFNLKGLRKQYAKTRVLVLVDEASMIGSELWRKLVELKKALPLSVWMILGDEGQCRPVGEEETDFFESSMVRFLAAGIRINLTKIQRYDLELAELAFAIRTGQPFVKKRGHLMAGRHLCYYNKTRMWLNARLNEKRGIFVAAGDQEGAQDAWLYPGAPLIAVRNYSRGDQIFCVNAEQFEIRSVTDSTMTVVSTRPDGEHEWTLPTKDVHNWFHLNFASTVHKSQGDTLTGPITIWDHDGMSARVLYTAVTRAKSLRQIMFA